MFKSIHNEAYNNFVLIVFFKFIKLGFSNTIFLSFNNLI